MTYLYEGEKPDAASQIGEDRYTYDDNGNPTLIVSDSTTRTITWDEENRMVMLNDDGYVSRYTYDFSGTRVIKSHGLQESVYINGAEQGLDYHDADNYTLYVSPYLIVSNERFTKHYYAGTQRIASKVGSGDFYNVYGVNGFHLTAGDKDYKERLEQIEEGVKEYYNANGIPPGEPTMKGSNADPYVADVALPNAELGDYSVPTDWPTNVKFNEPGDVPGPVVQFEDEDLGDVKAGYGFESDNLYEGDWFFFHTDHLGSTSYLTDTAGNVSQFVCYTPYGEAIVDEHLTTYENPFKFSGKELDDITGLYDHGARSRNPISTLWYGVDPLWEKYPDFSPYNYCAGNPVKLVDPDVRAVTADKLSQTNIRNTLSKEEEKYIKFDKEGNLDNRLLQKCGSNSRNITALKTLSGSKLNYNFQVREQNHSGLKYQDDDANNYRRGDTEFPNAESCPSPDECVYVIVGKSLSPLQKTKTTAHEAYGHAYIYEISGHDIDKASHTYENRPGEPYFDEETEMETYPQIRVPNNIKLEEQIDAAVHEAEQNYNSKNE